MRFRIAPIVFLLAVDLLLLAEASGAPADFGGYLTYVNIGLAGIGLLAFVKGWIVPGVTYKESLEREAKTKGELDTLRDSVDNQIMPALERARTVQASLVDLTERFMDFIDEKEGNA